MFKVENDIFRWLVRAVPEAHWQRIENAGSLGPGVPDVNCCHRGTETWIELKTAHGLRLHPSQSVWMRRRVAHGGRVRLLIGWRNGDLCTVRPPAACDAAIVKSILAKYRGCKGYCTTDHVTFWPRDYLVKFPERLAEGLLS